MTRTVVLLLALEALAIAALLTLALDVHAHTRVESLGGVNVWGYRGPVARQRQANEIRIAIVGGTRAFGWGQAGPALATEIRRLIMLQTDRPGHPLRPVVVVDLAQLGAGPDAYPSAMAHYAYLRPDYIVLYDDLGEPGAAPTRLRSAVFEATGYAPALPLVLREKGMRWRFGDVALGYAPAARLTPRDPSSLTPRAPSAIVRAAGTLLEGVGDALGAADRIAARSSDDGERRAPASGYVDVMLRAVAAARGLAPRGVVVAIGPAETPTQFANGRALRMRLGAVPLVDLDADADLRRPDWRIDGWSYGGAGTALVAERIAAALVKLIPTS